MNYNAYTGNRKSLLFSLKFWALTLLLVLFYTTLLFAQNIVYIDPTNSGDPAEDGTQEHPFDSWGDFTLAENTTYLQKAGTEFQLSGTINIDNISNVTISSYGEGERPILNSNPGSNAAIIRVARASNTVVDGMALIGNLSNSPEGGVFVSGHWSAGGDPTLNTVVNNCEIAYCYNGVRGVPASTPIETITVTNCDIHHINEDGVFIKHCENITIENCHMWHINLDWHIQGHLESQSPGDCIHILGDCDNYLIKDNILDRRYTGNKFCFIYGNTSYTPSVSGRVIGNTMYPPKDTITSNGGAAMYFSESGYVEVAYNKIIGRDYEWGGTPVAIAHMEVDSIDFYYNLMDSVTGCNFVMKNDYANVYNNTLIANKDAGWGILFSGTESGYVRNNIVALKSGYPIYFNNTGLVNENNLMIEGNVSTWNQEIGIASWENGNFMLTSGSNCVNSGYNYSSYPIDLNNTPVPQGGCRDLGSYEFIEGGAVNNPPVINNQTFSIDENSASGESVGVVVASDPDPDQTITFSIQSGNASNAFSIDEVSGELTVNNQAALNYENTPAFNMVIMVTDNGTSPMSSSASVTVNLNDLNENPVIDDQDFEIEENTSNGQTVGSVIATDPDNGQSLTYNIVSGNSSNAFQINESTGEITVANSTALDFESVTVFTLTVEVEDNGLGNLSDQALVTIDILDVNEIPEIANQSYTVAENSSNGFLVGTVVATDPDQGQTLTYSISSGNVSGAFQIDPVSGELTIANSSVINFEENPVFELSVNVEDNGQGNLSAEADITINLTDVNEPPVIITESLTVNVNGALIQHEISNIKINVGFIEAEDPDAGQSVSYAIITGNERSMWSLNPQTGKLSLINPYELNPVEIHNYPLEIEVEDNSAGSLTGSSTINVYVNIYFPNPNGNENTLTDVESSNIDDFAYNLYPNPVNDHLNLDFSKVIADDQEFEVSILNMSGELLQKQTLYAMNSEFSERLNVSRLSKGMYIVVINHGKVSRYGKFIKR
ncbi:MAG: cadherin domain-containing protein [Bacteroidetes bacterium]|nr:cadherin domain-containing protein [Bacteroidota bacterium]